MIDIIITSYKEPNATLRAVNSFLAQNIFSDFRITVVDPFPEVEEVIKNNINDKRVRFFLDPGEGKSYALNLLFQEYASKDRNDLFILSDGDVYVSENSVSEILRVFQDLSVGCVTGRPVPLESRSDKYGYWANVLFDGIHKVRMRKHIEKKFFECSGYLFAIRKGVILDFPLEVSEDSIIPYLFWKNNYNIGYAHKAEVYVKNPSSWKDWMKQKIRNVKGHENLNRIAPDMPRTKTFLNEIKEGAIFALFQPRRFREIYWTFQLYVARLEMYRRAFNELRKKRNYSDGWRGDGEILSAKPLDA